MPPKRTFRESGASSSDASKSRDTGAGSSYDPVRAQVYELSTQEGRGDHGAGSSQSQPYHEIFNQQLKDARIDYYIEKNIELFNHRCDTPQNELRQLKDRLEENHSKYTQGEKNKDAYIIEIKEIDLLTGICYKYGIEYICLHFPTQDDKFCRQLSPEQKKEVDSIENTFLEERMAGWRGFMDDMEGLVNNLQMTNPFLESLGAR